LTNHRTIDDYSDMPTEHDISLEYLTYFIVLHCVLAAFCQLLLNEYCIVVPMLPCIQSRFGGLVLGLGDPIIASQNAWP